MVLKEIMTLIILYNIAFCACFRLISFFKLSKYKLHKNFQCQSSSILLVPLEFRSLFWSHSSLINNYTINKRQRQLKSHLFKSPSTTSKHHACFNSNRKGWIKWEVSFEKTDGIWFSKWLHNWEARSFRSYTRLKRVLPFIQ